MDHIISLNTYNKSDLQAINRCRVYLQVVPPSRHANNKYAFHHATSHIPSHNIFPAIVTRFQSSIVHLDSILPNDISPLPVSPHNNHCTLFFIQIQTDPRKEANMTTYLQNHTAIAVTDASFSPYSGIGVSSFIISNTELNNCVTGSHGVPPGSNPMDSYRAELYGIFTIMKYLSYLCHKHAITDGEVLIACDNKASLEHALVMIIAHLYLIAVLIYYGQFTILSAHCPLPFAINMCVYIKTTLVDPYHYSKLSIVLLINRPALIVPSLKPHINIITPPSIVWTIGFVSSIIKSLLKILPPTSPSPILVHLAHTLR